MTDMKSIVSMAVVAVFLVIVFRKRVVPLFKAFKDHPGKQASVKALPDLSGRSAAGAGYAYYDALAFDAAVYDNDLKQFCEDLSVQLKRKLDYLEMNGTVLNVDFVPFGSILLIMIYWQPLAGERK